jgi:hypothetical protein
VLVPGVLRREAEMMPPAAYPAWHIVSTFSNNILGIVKIQQGKRKLGYSFFVIPSLHMSMREVFERGKIATEGYIQSQPHKHSLSSPSISLQPHPRCSSLSLAGIPLLLPLRILSLVQIRSSFVRIRYLSLRRERALEFKKEKGWIEIGNQEVGL